MLEDRRLLDGAAESGRIVFVDHDAPGLNNGSSWQDAYRTLSSALAVAISGDEIRVAEGVYTPAAPAGSRAATFQLISGVTING